MADAYFDFSHGLYKVYEAWDDYFKSSDDGTFKTQIQKNKKSRTVYPVPQYEVRRTVCVVGRHSETVQDIKRQISGLLEEPFPVESFHVKQPSDVQEDAFLVPKIVLVANHCPGRKLIDQSGDEGQLDWLYDQVVHTGADLMVIYANLPSKIYPSMRHIIYHPKIGDNLFPDQPILKDLACENCFLTVTEGAELNKMQRNMLREWLNKSVNENHPVFQTADFLTSHELSTREDFKPTSDFAAIEETATMEKDFSDSLNDSLTSEDHFVAAKEEHPLADMKRQRRKRFKFKFRRTPRRVQASSDSREDNFDDSSVELDLYNTSSKMEAGTTIF